MSTLIKLRRDTAANWASADPVLQLGEPGYDTTNNELRIGDGTTAWSGLTPIAGGGEAGLPLANGTSNFNIAAASGNATVTVAGARTWTFDTTGNVTIPGDIIGLVNPGTYRIGDILYSSPIPPKLKPLPVFPPELFATISCPDSLHLKSFKKGIEQLAEEGILRLYTSKVIGGGNPIIGAMGSLQFEVFQRRLKDEYNVLTNLHTLPYSVCRWVKNSSVSQLPSSANQISDKDRRVAVLFEGDWEFNYFKKNFPEIELTESPLYV